MLCENPNAIRLLEENPDEISWFGLSFNTNAIHLLEKNQDKIDWTSLCFNPNAIHLLEKNQDKIDWEELCINPSIFKLDTIKMKETCKVFAKELTEYVFHPLRLQRLSQNYDIEFADLLDIY